MGKYSFSDDQDKRREERRPKPKARPKKRIARQSNKRKKEVVIYRRQVKAAIEKDPICKIQSPACTGFAEGLDHTQKRSPLNYLKESNQKPACNACNLYKELHPQWAIDNGHSISRFAPTP